MGVGRAGTRNDYYPHASFEEIARALLKRPRVLIFDEAVSSLDQTTAEHFAGTVNKLKGKVTMLFITHQLPKALQVDEVINFGRPEAGTDQPASH